MRFFFQEDSNNNGHLPFSFNFISLFSHRKITPDTLTMQDQTLLPTGKATNSRLNIQAMNGVAKNEQGGMSMDLNLRP
jgi:hypothetical protein